MSDKFEKVGYTFTVTPNALINDTRLDRAAKMIVIELLSKPDDWRPRIGNLATAGLDGEKATRAALRRAQEAGYVTRFRVRNPETNLFSTLTQVHAIALDPPPKTGEDGYTVVRVGTAIPGLAAGGSPGRGESPASRRLTKHSGPNTEEQLRTTITRGRAPRSGSGAGQVTGTGSEADDIPDPIARLRASNPDSPGSGDAPRPRRRRPPGPDTAPGLAEYYAAVVRPRAKVWGDYPKGAIEAHLKRVMLQREVSPEQVRFMIDLYTEDHWAMEEAEDVHKTFMARDRTTKLVISAKAADLDDGLSDYHRKD